MEVLSSQASSSLLTEEQIKAQYRTDLDVRELTKDVSKYKDWKLYFEGEVLTIYGGEDGTQIQLMVKYPGQGPYDEDEIIIINTLGDTPGIYKNSRVAVWGRPVRTVEFQNMLGGIVSQPLLTADYVEKL
ncbi:hypothetical protein NITHO_6200001 [Nitrolancea hollandica Lb]|uniref:Uncharacterized protein n=1 Tax=Nitrolancea hollandica Lb TaxID=1129897 RepID=I4EMM7_9BACT|nr:hypothetical protein NITHO_6200001 [Nitrolancea hollandica Lb]